MAVITNLLSLYITILVLLSCHSIRIHTSVINVGVILPIAPPFAMVPEMAMFLQVNEDALLDNVDPTGTHSFQVQYIPNDPPWSHFTAFQYALEQFSLMGTIGDVLEDSTKIYALAGARSYTWTCSGAVDLYDTSSERDSFPYFFSTFPSNTQLIMAYINFIRAMNWKSISIIATKYTDHVMTPMVKEARSAGINVATQILFDLLMPDDILNQTLTKLYTSGSQIVVFCDWLSPYVRLVQLARENEMFDDQWVWIAPPVFHDWAATPDLTFNLTDMNGFLSIKWDENTYNTKYNDSVARFQDAYPDTMIPRNTFYTADCVTAITKGLIRIIHDVGITNFTTKNYIPDLKKYFLHPFDGLTGSIIFNDKGNRLGNWEVYNWYSGNATQVFQGYVDGSVVQIAPVRFASGRTDIPLDHMYHKNLAPNWKNTTGLILGTLNAILLVFIITIGIYLITAREQTIVQNLNFPFLCFISFGCILVLTSILITFNGPTTTSCQTSLWLFSLGFVVVYASCLIKTNRIYLRFNDSSQTTKKIDSRIITIIQISSIVLGQVIILTTWSTVAPQQPKRIEGHSYYYEQCKLSDSVQSFALMGINFIFNFILLSIVMVYSLLTRHIATNLGETRWIFKVSQTTVIIGITLFALSLINFDESTLSVSIINYSSILLIVGFTFCSLVGRVAFTDFYERYVLERKKNFLNRKNQMGTSQGRLWMSNNKDSLTMRTSTLKHASTISLNQIFNTNRSPYKSQNQYNENYLLGEFHFKPLSQLKASWLACYASINFNLGVFYLMPSDPSNGAGWSSWLSQITVEDSYSADNCLQVLLKGEAFDIKFPDNKECTAWKLAFNQGKCERQGGKS